MQFDTGDAFKIDFDELEVDRDFPVSNGHIWIIVSDTSEDPVLLLSCSSIKSGSPKNDRTCILAPNDHPALTESESFIYYRRPFAFHLDELRKAYHNGNLIVKSSLKDSVLEKVQKGALESDRIPSHYQTYLKEQDLV